MNSVPSCRAGQIVTARTATAIRITRILARMTALITGR
jgi:hypothetical protein